MSPLLSVRRNFYCQLARLLLIFLLVILLSLIASDTRFGRSAVLVGAGDISSCDNDNDQATAKLLDTITGTVFILGDNVYIDATYSDFTNCYHPTWGRHKDRTKPVPGNHEYFTTDAAGYFQYFDNVPPYYAYDLGDWRIYALNSEIDVSSTSPQIQWLKNDLVVKSRLCVLAYWHTPLWSTRYEDGSDSTYETLWKTLHDAGAELVVNGHVHNYERFKEMNADGLAVSPGLREIVVGTGGVNHDRYVGTSLSTSEVLNSSTYGVLKLILSPTNYSWEFVPVSGGPFKDTGSTNCH